MKYLVALFLLLAGSMCFAGLPEDFIRGTEKGLEANKAITRGETKILFERYDDILSQRIDSLLNASSELISGKLESLDSEVKMAQERISNIPEPKDYTDDIETLKKSLDVIVAKLKRQDDNISKLRRASGEEAVLGFQYYDEYDMPWYVKSEMLNSLSGLGVQIIEAGYDFKYFNGDYVLTGTPIVRYSAGNLQVGAKAELRWGSRK